MSSIQLQSLKLKRFAESYSDDGNSGGLIGGVVVSVAAVVAIAAFVAFRRRRNARQKQQDNAGENERQELEAQVVPDVQANQVSQAGSFPLAEAVVLPDSQSLSQTQQDSQQEPQQQPLRTLPQYKDQGGTFPGEGSSYLSECSV